MSPRSARRGKHAQRSRHDPLKENTLTVTGRVPSTNGRGNQGLQLTASATGDNGVGRQATSNQAPVSIGTMPGNLANVDESSSGEGAQSSNLGKGQNGMLKPLLNVFKPYQGDLFSSFDHSDGMLYLSRVHYGMSPEKEVPQTEEERRKTTMLNNEESRRAREAQQDWRNPHALERRRRFAASLASLSSRPDKSIDIIREGALPVLLKLAGMPDHQIMCSCAVAFAHLANQTDLRSQIIEAGAVPVLIELLSTGGRKVQRDCIETLCSLSVCPGYEARLVADGIVPVLVSIGSVAASLADIAIIIMLNLTYVPERYAGLEELEEAALHYVGCNFTPDMIMIMLKFLCNFTGLKCAPQTKIVEEGIVETVHNIFKTSNLEGRTLCAKIIANLSTCPRSRSKLVDHKVIFAILDFLKVETPVIQNQCALTVTRLSAEPGCREKLLQHGAIKVILEMSLRSNLALESCRACAMALRAFCTDKILAKRVVKAGGIRALINLINLSGDLQAKQEATRGLCWLFQYPESIPYLIEEGSVPVIVSMTTSRHAVCAPYCASALYAVSWHADCTPDIIDETAVRALNELCESEALDARRRAVASLWSLTQNVGKSADPRVSISALLKLLRREADRDITRLCAAALCNLAVDIRNCQQMLEEGAVPPMIALCLADNTMTKVQCGAILCRLATEPRNRPELVTKEYIRTLLSLVEVEDRATQQRSIVALVHMSNEVGGRELLLEQRAPLLMVQLSAKPDELIRRGCAAVLCNLALQSGSERLMVKSGVVSCLLIIALVATDNDDTRSTCAKGVFNLLSEPATYKAIVDDGAVWGFATLSRTPRAEVSRICATALCNLGYEYPAAVLLPSSFRAILHIMEHAVDLTTQILAAQALANVLYRTREVIKLEAVQVRLKPTAVPVLTRMIHSQVSEIAVLSSRCLTYLAELEGGRDVLLGENGIAQINEALVVSSLRYSFDHALVIASLCVAEDSRDRAPTAGCLRRLTLLSTCPTDILDEPTIICCLRALYCLSCSPLHLETVVLQGGIQAARGFLDALPSETITNEVRAVVAAFVYNLSTCFSTLAELVLQGAVRLMRDYIWDIAAPRLDTLELCSRASCLIACGHINSSRAVEEGIHCMVTYLARPDADPETTRRCTVALRKLIRVNANHDRLVNDGAVKAIVNLFKVDDLITKQQGAAALRQLTHNQAFRVLMVESGAINVIIEDSKMQDDEDDDDLPLNMNLLFEIEAEAWSQGSQSHEREGPLPPFEAPRLETSLASDCDCRPFRVPTQYIAAWYKLPGEMPTSSEINTHDLTSGFTASSFSGMSLLRGTREHDLDLTTNIMVGGKTPCPVAPARSPRAIIISSQPARVETSGDSGKREAGRDAASARKKEIQGEKGVRMSVPCGVMQPSGRPGHNGPEESSLSVNTLLRSTKHTTLLEKKASARGHGAEFLSTVTSWEGKTNKITVCDIGALTSGPVRNHLESKMFASTTASLRTPVLQQGQLTAAGELMDGPAISKASRQPHFSTTISSSAIFQLQDEVNPRTSSLSPKSLMTGAIFPSTPQDSELLPLRETFSGAGSTSPKSEKSLRERVQKPTVPRDMLRDQEIDRLINVFQSANSLTSYVEALTKKRCR